MSTTQLLAPEAISLRIATVRGQRVIVDADLAALYDVPTKRFNEAVKRNLAKFPADFMFTLTAEEWAGLRSQFATLNARSTQAAHRLCHARRQEGRSQRVEAQGLIAGQERPTRPRAECGFMQSKSTLRWL